MKSRILFRVLFSACLLAGQAFAIDTDSDGVDDSLDAFPVDFCASTDTDADGMPDLISNCFYEGFDGVHVGPDWYSLSSDGWVDGGGYAGSGKIIRCINLYSCTYDTLHITLTVPAVFSFWHKTNEINIVINGEYNTVPFHADWSLYTTILPAGEHVIAWQPVVEIGTTNYDEVVIGNQSVLVEDMDDDNDGLLDVADNCVAVSNVGQEDNDGDGIGNACDAEPYSSTREAVFLSLGSEHSCIVTTANGAACWGRNQAGQLGDNTTISREKPVDVSGLTSGVSKIAAGSAHSCALTTSGGAKCWGSNSSGRLGDGTTTARLTPVDVSGLTSGVSEIATGTSHTCVLTASGGVKCWGSNSSGRLGDGTTTTRLTPVDVSGLTSGVDKIETGGSHSCALTAGGGVKCWGSNSNGQLGDGTTTTRLTPVDVSSLTSGVGEIAAGGSHTCALTAGGGVKCWGYNSDGQLGDGTVTTRLTPIDVMGLTSGVVALATGSSHTCAVITGGGVKCWGKGWSGQIGNNTEWNSFAVPQDVVGLASGAAAISAGSSHSCALTVSGGLRCWGDNSNGQIGDNTTTNRLIPVYVVGLMGDGDDDVVVDRYDNCPSIGNQDQVDTDGDVEGDACDADDDNDSVPDINDAFPLDASESVDTDVDGTGNNADTDDDNDGVLDAADKFPLNASISKYIRHDTDMDGDSDILTRSASLGTWTRHMVNNAAIIVSNSMNAYTSSSMQYQAQLDANGDGDADILTRNTSTGAWYLHQVQDGEVTGTTPIYLYANLDQQFVGAGDFNNDGTDDVMLRSASGGYYTVFLLANHAVNSTVFYNAWTSSQSVPQGIGDFDGDGTDDLLVRRTSDNLYFIFKTTSGGTSSYACACNVWSNPDWTFQFAGDTNKDGTDDIVIRGTGATGDGLWWNFRMSNFLSTQTTNLNTFSNKTLVNFAASGDYNGDGHTDMLIRVNNGPVYVARIVNGLVSGSTTLLSNLPADQVVLK